MNKTTIVLVLAIALILGTIWYLGSSVSTTEVTAPVAVTPVSPTSDIDADLAAINVDSSDADVQKLDADLNQL